MRSLPWGDTSEEFSEQAALVTDGEYVQIGASLTHQCASDRAKYATVCLFGFLSKCQFIQLGTWGIFLFGCKMSAILL